MAGHDFRLSFSLRSEYPELQLAPKKRRSKPKVRKQYHPHPATRAMHREIFSGFDRAIERDDYYG